MANVRVTLDQHELEFLLDLVVENRIEGGICTHGYSAYAILSDASDRMSVKLVKELSA